MTQTFKTLAINSFIARRMEQKKDLLESRQAFQSLTSYWHSFNPVQSLADFGYEVSRELLISQSLETGDAVCGEEIDGVSDNEVIMLCNITARRRQKRSLFLTEQMGSDCDSASKIML